MLNEMFQSVIDQDRASVVICNLEHEIVYMNPPQWKIIPNGWSGSCRKKSVKLP